MPPRGTGRWRAPSHTRHTGRVNLSDLLADSDLPVAAAARDIAETTHPGDALVISAPPGTGKTTLVPPALAQALGAEPTQRVIVVQPRRVAARASARRLAHLLHEKPGERSGFSVRGESRTSPETLVEALTPGILLRRLQRDPELTGVGAVVVDEFHERHADTDLALAFLLDVRAGLREDLIVAIMSATLDVATVEGLVGEALGVPPRHVDVPGVLHSVAVRWSPPPRGVEPIDINRWGRVGPTPGFLGHVASVVSEALSIDEGDALVFLPGRSEIERVRSQLTHVDADVEVLHGGLAAREQDRVLSGGGGVSGRRRVVLTTSLAESSLTVPGVRIVVDSCLAREPRTDAARGIGMLATVPESAARGEQRAGRAGREAPGSAWRCTAESDWARRPAQSTPEILQVPLDDLLLQAAAWGNPGGRGLAFAAPPPEGATAATEERLRAIGAVDAEGKATAHGRELAALPLEPALGHALLGAAPAIGSQVAAEGVALLSEDIRVNGADLAAGLREMRRGGTPQATRWKEQVRRLQRLVPNVRAKDRAGADGALALVAALARPQWIARARGTGRSYLLASGMGATLPENSPLIGQEWLAIAAMRIQGRDATIDAAAPLDARDAEKAGADLITRELVVGHTAKRVTARDELRLGAIPLTSRRRDDIPEDEGYGAARALVNENGVPWTDDSRSLRERMQALHDAIGAPWPDVSDEWIAGHVDEFLAADLPRLAKGAPLASVDTMSALRAMLPWPEASRLDELAPTHVEIPTGDRKKLDWSDGRPVLTLRIQQAFGWKDSPTVADGRLPVLLHLTDPAGRPAGVTSDLASFWGEGYRQARAQLRGRYPRHPWPEDAANAEPTSRAKRRR